TYVANTTHWGSMNGSSGKFMVINDISMSGYTTMLGSFAGTLDGQGFTISGWAVNDGSNLTYAGMIQQNSGTITNLKISNCTLKNDNQTSTDCDIWAGILCGINTGTISKVHITGGSVDARRGVWSYYYDAYVGGIVGRNTGTITKSSVTSVSIYGRAESNQHEGRTYVGGIAGTTAGSSNINNSYVKSCTITAESKGEWLIFVGRGRPYTHVGGLIGYSEACTISNVVVYGNSVTSYRICNENFGAGYGGTIVGWGTTSSSNVYGMSTDTVRMQFTCDGSDTYISNHVGSGSAITVTDKTSAECDTLASSMIA
ncbi:MAG: hypothetical protein IKC79_02875, partial [Clostridia bacterium]|nr:hypothetical protein [Clostridia bacterium]